jgi:hypothetical protein|tara:strand:+ start:632 stop:853 length:222 start_codon:yes stop_codon:yes gene_type:complete
MKKIKFLEDQFIECFDFDSNGDVHMEEEKVLKGEAFEVEFMVYSDYDDSIIQIQFGNGSVSFIPREWIEIVNN